MFTVGYDDDYIATKYGRRIRAASPVNYRRPLSERFDDGLTPRYSDHISHSVDHALRRNRYDNPARLHSSYVSTQCKRCTTTVTSARVIRFRTTLSRRVPEEHSDNTKHLSWRAK